MNFSTNFKSSPLNNPLFIISVTYSSNNTSGATINSSTGVITVANGNSKAVTITASMAGTTTVKAASITRAFTTGKHENTINLTCATPTYNKSAQNLLSAKTATGGSVYIATTSLTSSNYSTSGSTDLSGAQGTNATSYTVYAYTPGNDNYVAASTSKSCSISTKALDPSKFTTGSTSKTYDGTNSSSITLTANTTSGLISGDSVTVSYTSATYNATTVAATTINVSGISINNSNYTLTSTTGSYSGTITAKPITVTATNQSKTYDGTALSADTTCSVTSGSLLTGDTVTCTNTGTQTNAGSGTKTLSTVVVKNSSNTDVSANYAITTIDGTLTVNPKGLAIDAYSTVLVSGATTYTRSNYATNTNNETITLTYTPNTNAAGSYTYATTTGTGKYLLSLSSANYTITSAGNLTLTAITVGLNGNGGGIPATTGWTIGTNGDGYQYATKSISYGSTYGTLPTPDREGYTFKGWYSTLSLGNITFEQSSNNYNFQILEYALQPGVTYKVTMDSATITSGSATQFDIYAYDFTSDAVVGWALGTYGGTNLSYDIAVPSDAVASHSIRLIIYAGRSGSTAGNAVSYNNVKIGTMGNTTETQITSSTTMSTAYDHQLVAKWAINKVTLTLQKGTSNTACTSCNGYTVHISTSSTNDTASFTGTTTTATTLVINGAMSTSNTYYVWVAKDENHKTAGTSNANMAYSGVSFTGAEAATGIIHFYTVTMSLSNSTMTFNGTSVADSGTVVALGTGTDNKIHSIAATANTDYVFDNWTSSSVSSAIASTTSASTTMNVGADTTLSTTTHLNARTVTYDCATNGGSGDTTDSVNVGSAIDLSVACTKSGYTHAGWNTDSTATSTLSSLTMGSSDITIYAIYSKTVTITFNKNGNTSQTPSGGSASTANTIDVSCTMYNTATTCSVTSPTIGAHSNTPNVIGYSTAAGTHSSTWNQNTAANVSANATYFAQTTSNIPSFCVNFAKNCGSTSDTTSQLCCSPSATYNGTAVGTSCNVTAPSVPTCTNTPTAIGWNTSSTATTSSLNAGATVSATSTTATYYGITRSNSTITRTGTFNKNTCSSVGATSGSCTIGYSYNGAAQASSCTITLPSTTATSGNTAFGWSTSSSGAATIYPAGTALAFSANATYYCIQGITTTDITGCTNDAWETSRCIFKGSSVSE